MAEYVKGNADKEDVEAAATTVKLKVATTILDGAGLIGVLSPPGHAVKNLLSLFDYCYEHRDIPVYADLLGIIETLRDATNDLDCFANEIQDKSCHLGLHFNPFACLGATWLAHRLESNNPRALAWVASSNVDIHVQDNSGEILYVDSSGEVNRSPGVPGWILYGTEGQELCTLEDSAGSATVTLVPRPTNRASHALGTVASSESESTTATLDAFVPDGQGGILAFSFQNLTIGSKGKVQVSFSVGDNAPVAHIDTDGDGNFEASQPPSETHYLKPGVPPLSDPGPNIYLIPASAHAPGLGGTSWVSDVVLYNQGSSTANVNLYYLQGNHDHTRTTGKRITVPAGASVKLGDVVGDTFGSSSTSGALFIGSDQELLITSRTYNNASSGTYGQFIAGVPVGDAIGANQTVRLIQLTRNGDYRTNIGFANASDQTVAVAVKLYRNDGSLIATRNYTLQPYGFYQKTDIIGTDVSDAYAVVSSSTSGAKFFTYASVIDNRTGDPVYITPGVGTASAGQSLYIPGSAHANGASGTQWRSDVEIHNPGSTTATYRIELLKRDQANSSPQAKTYSLAAGHSVRYSDALNTLFGFTGAAALRITPSAGTITVTSRTYNEASGGTYGQFIPAVPASSAISSGDSVPLIQLADSASTSSGYRTNIGFVNTTNKTISVKADLYDGSGTKLGTKLVTLRAYEYKQIDRIFRSVTANTLNNCYALLSTSTSGGSFLAYGSVVDNRSGDPVYVPATVGGRQVENGLVAYYPLDGDAHDASGNGYDGRLVGASPTVGVDGHQGGALTFDGSGDYVDLSALAPALAAIEDPNTGSISMWFKADPSLTLAAIFATMGGDQGPKILLGNLSGYSTSESIGWTEGNSCIAGSLYEQGNGFFFDNVWHHVVVVMGTDFNTMYIDGSAVETYYAAGIGSPDTGDCMWGAGIDEVELGRIDGQPQYDFKGAIDELRIYSRPLSENEVQELYAAGRAGS